MLREFAPEIWVSGGPEIVVAGFRYPTRMAVMRLADGALVVWSPTELTASLRAETEALGPVRHILAPNSLHHLALTGWQEAFPDAAIHAAPGLAAKRADITFAAELTETPGPWADEIDQVVMRGNRITTEVVFFHRPSGTVLFTDLLQNFPKGWHRGWQAAVARLDLMAEDEPTVPRKFRLAFTNRRAARDALARILAWPAQNVLMAHGTPIRADAKPFLVRAFRWLTR